jgi:hypothetical protein
MLIHKSTKTPWMKEQTIECLYDHKKTQKNAGNHSCPRGKSIPRPLDIRSRRWARMTSGKAADSTIESKSE